MSTVSDNGQMSYRDRDPSAREKLFAARLTESSKVVVPAAVKRLIGNATLSSCRGALSASYPTLAFSEFEILAYAFARAAASDVRFRTTVKSDGTLREYDHINLGIAVATPTDELFTAVVQQADALDFPTFVDNSQTAVIRAMQGADQVRGSTQVLFSNLAFHDIIDAAPTLVAPSVAVLVVGSPFLCGIAEQRIASLTFDHRYINGIVAAKVLGRFAAELELMSGRASTRTTVGIPVDQTAPRQIDDIRNALRQMVSEALGCALARVRDDVPLRLQGLHSLQSVEVTAKLSQLLERELPATLTWNFPTITAIANHLALQTDHPLHLAEHQENMGSLQALLENTAKLTPQQIAEVSDRSTTNAPAEDDPV